MVHTRRHDTPLSKECPVFLKVTCLKRAAPVACEAGGMGGLRTAGGSHHSLRASCRRPAYRGRRECTPGVGCPPGGIDGQPMWKGRVRSAVPLIDLSSANRPLSGSSRMSPLRTRDGERGGHRMEPARRSARVGRPNETHPWLRRRGRIGSTGCTARRVSLSWPKNDLLFRHIPEWETWASGAVLCGHRTY